MPTATNAPLRRRLGYVLGVLVATAIVCVADPRGPAAAVPLSERSATSERPSRTPTATRTAMPPETPSTTAAALRAGGGCGFTVGGPRDGGTAPGHCTVLEIGDSLGSDLGWGLAREVAPASGLKVVQLDKSSTGLAVPSFYNWPAQLATALPRYRPQLVIICLGGNDQQGMEVNGKSVPFGTPAWRTAYRDRVRQLAGETSRAGAFVLWVGLPVMQQPTYDRGSQELDAEFQSGIRNLPGAAYLSTRTLFADRTGAYASVGTIRGAKTELRQSDGIHLSYGGENVVATFVVQEMSELYGVKIVPTMPAVIQ